MSDVAIGQTVQVLADGRLATVRYVGQPHFAAGDWVGIELGDESGKNDGSVQGERYFECDMGSGDVRSTYSHYNCSATGTRSKTGRWGTSSKTWTTAKQLDDDQTWTKNKARCQIRGQPKG